MLVLRSVVFRVGAYGSMPHNLPKAKPNARNLIWEFPKIRGTVFWGHYNKDTIKGTILGSPIFGNPHLEQKRHLER